MSRPNASAELRNANKRIDMLRRENESLKFQLNTTGSMERGKKMENELAEKMRQMEGLAEDNKTLKQVSAHRVM